MLKDNQRFNEFVKPNSAFLDELKQKLPDFFTSEKYDEDGNIIENSTFDNEKFQQALKEYNITELSSGYRLDFIGKNYAKKQAGERPTTVIVPDNDHNQKEENKNSKNLFFTGDNLEVLRHLQQNYYNSVDFIYIDPPYNTGSDDFVYPDNFDYTDDQLKNMFALNEDDLNRLKSIQGKSTHAAWLTFMYPRLYIAKKLLKETGLIFVSIDDNEQANLKLLMDEVFGEANFINQFAWIVNLTGRQISGQGAAKTYENIIVYSKNSSFSKSFEVNIKTAKEKMPIAYKGFNKEILVDDIGEYAVGDTLWNHNRIFNEETRPNLVYSIFFNPETGDIVPDDIGKKIEGYIEIKPHRNQNGTHQYHAWRWSREKVFNEKKDLLIRKLKKGWEIYTKIRVFDKTLLKDLITNISNGDLEFIKLFDNQKLFNYPKSTSLLKILIGAISNKDAIILDFFAGSSTTADAVMQLNTEDGGNRQFIMCTLPEPTFTVNSDGKEVPTKGGATAYKAGYKSIDEISRERIIRAANKIKDENPLLTETQDFGFKHYRVVPPTQDTLEKIDYTDQLQLDLFDDMIEAFSSEKLGVSGNSDGFDTILQTYLTKDNYQFDVATERVNFAGIQLPYVNNQRIYLIAKNWQAENTKALVNAIGKNEITVQTIVVYGYTIDMESLRELEIALNQLENKVNLQVRY